jgi:hypothetical protein
MIPYALHFAAYRFKFIRSTHGTHFRYFTHDAPPIFVRMAFGAECCVLRYQVRWRFPEGGCVMGCGCAAYPQVTFLFTRAGVFCEMSVLERLRPAWRVMESAFPNATSKSFTGFRTTCTRMHLGIMEPVDGFLNRWRRTIKACKPSKLRRLRHQA